MTSENCLTMNDIYEYNSSAIDDTDVNDFFEHYGILGMKWGIRKYQNADGTLTAAGRARYGGKMKNGSTKYGYRKEDADLTEKTLKKGTKIFRITSPGEELDDNPKYVYYNKADDSNIKAIMPWLAIQRGASYESSLSEKASFLRKNTYTLNADMKIAPIDIQRDYQRQMLKSPKTVEKIAINKVNNGYSKNDVDVLSKIYAGKTKEEQNKIMDSFAKQEAKRMYGDSPANVIRAEQKRIKANTKEIYDEYVDKIKENKLILKGDPELNTAAAKAIMDFSIGGVKDYQEGLSNYVKSKGYNAIYDAVMSTGGTRVEAADPLIILDTSIMTKVSEKRLTAKDYTKASIKAATWRTKVNDPYEYQEEQKRTIKKVLATAAAVPFNVAVGILATV